MSDDVLAPLGDASIASESARPTSALRAFLIADIRGYTSFTQRFGDERAAALAGRFAAATGSVVGAHDGTVLELRGDEALCVFTSPRQALRAAVALQRRFVEETRADPELPLRVGIGIDIGEAVAVEGGYRGGALNLAARLCSLAGAGQILATAEVTHLARRIDGLAYVPREAVKVKGVEEPIRPVRVVPAGDDPVRQLAALRGPPEPPPPAGPRWLPSRLRRRRWLAAAVVLLAAAVAAGTLVVVTGGRHQLTSLAENVAGVLDPAGRALTGQVPVGTNPTAIAVGAGAVWAVNTDDDTVSRVDPATRSVVQVIDVGGAPTAVAVGGGSVWVANSTSGTVSRIDPVTGKVRQAIPAGAAPAALVFDAGALWVADTASAELLRVDPDTAAVTARVAVGDSPSAVVAGGGRLWVSSSLDGTVTEVDPTSDTALPPVHVGNDPRGMALDGGSLWVANNLDGTVTRVDTATGSVLAVVPVGRGPVAVAVAAGMVWAADQQGAAITEIDPLRNVPVSTVPTASQPAALVAAGHAVWITAGARAALHFGGTFTAVLPQMVIDPAYPDAFSVPVQQMLFDGLVALRQAPGAAGYQVVPDLATGVPPPGDGGRSYTFRLRPGIRWSTGAPVTGRDVRRGIERAVASSALPAPIVGAGTCTTKACELSAGVAVDDAAGTVTIRLSKPDPEFFLELAAAFAAPAATPLTQVDQPLPTTGPYMVAEYRANASLTLVRNPHFREWSSAAQPAGFPDRMAFTIDPTWGDHPQQVPSSRYDWLDVRGADLDALRARFGGRLQISRRLAERYAFLNTSVAPFDNLDARRAVSYAIDREAVKADWPDPGQVTCQVLPPTVPGYRPFCPYTLRPDTNGTWQAPDLATAQRLVQRSGTAGAAVTVWTDSLVARAMQHVVVAMNEIGYRATLYVVPSNKPYFGMLHKHPEAQAGFVGWIGSYPSPSGFTDVSTCAAIGIGTNYARFCDPSIDGRITQALALEQQSPQKAGSAWAAVDRALTDAVPLVPLLVDTNAVLVSARVRHYEVDPAGPLYDQLWLK